jgi:hypothetical protein
MWRRRTVVRRPWKTGGSSLQFFIFSYTGKFTIEELEQMYYKIYMTLPTDVVREFALLIGTAALAGLVLLIGTFLGHFIGGALEGWS